MRVLDDDESSPCRGRSLPAGRGPGDCFRRFRGLGTLLAVGKYV